MSLDDQARQERWDGLVAMNATSVAFMRDCGASGLRQALSGRSDRNPFDFRILIANYWRRTATQSMIVRSKWSWSPIIAACMNRVISACGTPAASMALVTRPRIAAASPSPAKLTITLGYFGTVIGSVGEKAPTKSRGCQY
jgi:hypothetical protein